MIKMYCARHAQDKQELNAEKHKPDLSECIHTQNQLEVMVDGAKVQLPKLINVGEIIDNRASSSALPQVIDWIQSYLGKPHPELGRNGPVCPHIPYAMETSNVWLAEVTEQNLCKEAIKQIILHFKPRFQETKPNNDGSPINKAFIVVFANIALDNASLMDEVQQELKIEFVKEGLMLGEFHATNNSAGLRNPYFKPLRSDIPMLAIRHMVDSDLPFLMQEHYSADVKSKFLRVYINEMKQKLTTTKFNSVLEHIIAAEIEMALENEQYEPS